MGWNNAQDAISALTRTINDLNKGLKGVNTGVGQISRSRGMGLALGDVWNGTSNYAHGRSNGGQGRTGGPSGTGNGGGITFSNNGSQGGGSSNNGGQGGTNGGGGGGGTTTPRLGGGSGNNGGRPSQYNLKKGLSGVVSWGQKILPDQVTMQSTAYQAAQGSSSSWHVLRDQGFKNNFTAQSTQDAAQAYSVLGRTGLSSGSSSFNQQWNYVKGTSGYMNPGMSEQARAQGTAAAWTAGSYYANQAIGIQTIKSGQKQTPRQIAQQVLQRWPSLRNIKDAKQISGTLDNPQSGVMVSLAASMDPKTLELVKGELKGMMLAQIHGASAQAYVSTANQRDNGKTQESKNSAQSQLGKWGIGGSTANTLMTRAGTLRNQDVNENDGFTSGLQTATKYLNEFSTALQGVLQATGASTAMGWAGGAGSMLGSSIGTGIGAYGTMRGLASVGRLAGMGGSGGGLLGAARGAMGGAGAGGAAGGVLAPLAGAGGAIGGALALGYGASKFDRDGKTITGASTKGMGFGGWVKDTFSWTAIKRNLNPFYVLGDKNKNDGQGGGASSGSGPSAGAGKSGSKATGTQGAGKTASAVIKVAMKYLGVKYVWGGATPKGFDCSGLLMYCFRQIGVSLPRTAAQQQKTGSAVKLSDVRAGDLLFNGNPAHHVVMCIGGNKIIEAPHTGSVVRVRTFKPSEFTNARRILGSVGSMGDVASDTSKTAGSGENRLSTMGFGGDVGSYGSVEEVDALAAGVSSIGAASAGTGSSSDDSKEASDNGSPSGPMPKGSVAKWIKSALSIIKQDSSSNERIVNTMIQHESGGNPHAINNWDSNAKAGHPSKGIMQTIDSTFNAYSIKGHKDIWNPVDNIIAGVRYADSRYGSLANVPGIKSMSNGGGYKGYAVGSTNVDVDQNARIHKGEMIIPAFQAEAIRNVLAGNNAMSSVSGLHTKGAAATLQFNAGAITVKVQGAMDAQAARDAAQQFMTAIAEDDRINLIAAGN
ncbi:NlpC/P60 family protein [Streptomyces sp. NPDC006631]|uniref:NlpC/P60 family protein n=1 Tax=Streptomyces sp. NPDC006631 TaxID=3364752 RepID=UPI0036C2030D